MHSFSICFKVWVEVNGTISVHGKLWVEVGVIVWVKVWVRVNVLARVALDR